MDVRLVPPRDPRKVPSFTLWTMRKDCRTRQARTRLLPIGDGLPLAHQLAERRDVCDGAMPCTCEMGQQLAATFDAMYLTAQIVRFRPTR